MASREKSVHVHLLLYEWASLCGLRNTLILSSKRTRRSPTNNNRCVAANKIFIYFSTKCERIYFFQLLIFFWLYSFLCAVFCSSLTVFIDLRTERKKYLYNSVNMSLLLHRGIHFKHHPNLSAYFTICTHIVVRLEHVAWLCANITFRVSISHVRLGSIFLASHSQLYSVYINGCATSRNKESTPRTSHSMKETWNVKILSCWEIFGVGLAIHMYQCIHSHKPNRIASVPLEKRIQVAHGIFVIVRPFTAHIYIFFIYNAYTHTYS